MESYVERIRKYAQQHSISSDIIDDIFYNIIEKLYAGGVPVTEQYAITVANGIGEPDNIFGEADSSLDDASEPKKWKIQKDKPLIWGVCYWIAKSLGVSVTRVRILFLVLLLFRGSTFFLYIVLALFVPYKEKSKTTGRVGNFVFEIVRICLWLAVLCMLLPIVGGVTVGTGLVFFTPAIHNQSFAAWIPSHMYRTLGIACISLFILLIGSLGGLFKQKWITKTVALLSFIGLFVTALVTAGTMYEKALQIEMNEDNFFDTTVLTGSRNADTITLDIQDIENDIAWTDFPLIQNRVEVIPSTGDRVIVTVETALRAPSEEQKELNRQFYIPLTVTEDKGTVSVISPQKTFSQQVPFAFVRRFISIQVPQNKKIIAKDSEFLYSLKNHYFNDGEGKNTRTECAEDNTSYSYSGALNAFICDNVVVVQDYDNDREDHFDLEDRIEERVEQRVQERMDKVPFPTNDQFPPAPPELTGSDSSTGITY